MNIKQIVPIYMMTYNGLRRSLRQLDIIVRYNIKPIAAALPILKLHRLTERQVYLCGL